MKFTLCHSWLVIDWIKIVKESIWVSDRRKGFIWQKNNKEIENVSFKLDNLN